MPKKKTSRSTTKKNFFKTHKRLRWLLPLLILSLIFYLAYSKTNNKDEQSTKYNASITPTISNNSALDQPYNPEEQQLIKTKGNKTDDININEFSGTVEYDTVEFSVEYPASWEVESQKGLQHIFYPEGKINQKLVTLNISGLGSGRPESECRIEKFPASLMNYCFYDSIKDGVQYRNRSAWTEDDRNGDIIFRMYYPLEQENKYKEIFDKIITSLKY